MKKLSQVLESGSPKLTSLLSNFSGLKTLSSRLEKPRREKNVAEPDSALAFNSADLVEPDDDPIAATEAVQLAQAEAQAATDTDAGGVLFGGDGGVTTATATGSVGIGVGSVFATGALLRNSGSNGSGQVAPSGGSAVNPGGNEPVEEILTGGDFSEREIVTAGGVSITTTANAEATGMTTVGAIYSDIITDNEELTIEGTVVDQNTRTIVGANAFRVMADGDIDLVSRSIEATEFVGTFPIDPLIEDFGRGISEFISLLGIQATTIDLESVSGSISFFLLNGGNSFRQQVPDSSTVFPSVLTSYTASETITLTALDGDIFGFFASGKTFDLMANNISISVLAGSFDLGIQITSVEFGNTGPVILPGGEVVTEPDNGSDEITDAESRDFGTVTGAESVTLTASGSVDVQMFAKTLISNAASNDISVFGGGDLDISSDRDDESNDRDLGILPSDMVTITSTSETDSSSISVMSLQSTVVTSSADDFVELVNARGIAQTGTIRLGSGDDTVTVRSLFGELPEKDFAFSSGSSGTYTLTIQDGEVSDVFTLSGVETVEIRSSVGGDVLARFAIMDGVYTLQPMPDAVA